MNNSNFYEWSGSIEYPGYQGVNDHYRESMQWYDDLMGVPLPSKNDWDPPLLEQYLGENGKQDLLAIGDAPTAGLINLLSRKAAESLDIYLREHVDLYPVRLADSPEEEYFMVVCRTELDCLDREKSVGTRTGYESNPQYFASIHEWYFRNDCVGGANMFVLPDSPVTIYVSDKFKKLVIDSGLIGFCFKRSFWEENPFIS